MFKKLFGARTSKESTKKGVLEKKGAIELQLEALQKKQTQHEKQVEQQIKLAKEALSKEAGLAVKRKKQHEEQITKLQQQQSNLQTMIDQIDDSMMVADVLETKKTFLSSMKDIQQGIDIESAQKTMDDVQDAVSEANEIGRAISASIISTDCYEDEINDELIALELGITGASYEKENLPVKPAIKVDVSLKPEKSGPLTEEEELEALSLAA